MTYAQLLQLGWTRPAIRKALAAGLLHRVRIGWYDAGACSSDQLTATATGQRIGCLTGLRDQGVWVPPTTHPHLMSPRWVDRRSVAGVRHDLPRDADWPRDSITCGLVDCLRQVLRFHDVETCLMVLESSTGAHHTGETAYRSDRRRDLRAAALGYTVIRLTWEQVFLEWEATKILLVEHLSARRYRRAASTGA